MPNSPSGNLQVVEGVECIIDKYDLQVNQKYKNDPLMLNLWNLCKLMLKSEPEKRISAKEALDLLSNVLGERKLCPIDH